MEIDDQGNTPKLRRGRISLERKKEILEQYDQLKQCVSTADAAAMIGVTETTLAKIITERQLIRKTVTAKANKSDEFNRGSSTSKFKRGRLSLQRKKEILARYYQLPQCSTKDAAAELGVREETLLNILSSHGKLGATKRKLDGGSSSDSDYTAKNNRLRASSPQPGSSGLSMTKPSRNNGLNMSLREGRRVRVDYSEDEQSGSDYSLSGSDSEGDGKADTDQTFGEKVRKRPTFTPAQRQQILAKFDEMQPCSLSQAAPKLGITVSTLSIWLKQRSLNREKYINKVKLETEDSSWSGEEIDCYVMEPKGSNKGSQVVQFFEVADDRYKKTNSDDEVKKPHRRSLTLKERYDLFKKYDAMVSSAQWNAAANLNLPKAVWSDMITNRYYWEERYRMRLLKESAILKKYDEIDKLQAPRILGIAKSKLDTLLANRSTIEQDLEELETLVNDADSVDSNVDEPEPLWNNFKELESLEEELSNWLLEAKHNQVHVDRRALKEKAKELANSLGMEGFIPSNSWLRKWNAEYRMIWNQKGPLVTVYDSGENRTVSETVLTALKSFPPDNVFNLVETGLYFRAIPGHPPVTDDWLAVAFACNLSGTEKKKLLVVGNCKSPLCFKVIPIPLEYRYCKIPCMNENILTSYLQAWDEELAYSNRKIALILDSSSSHPNVHLKRIRLFFVPEDCSKEQPLNDGVVAYTKEQFRTRMAESLQNVQSSNARNPAEEITLVDALFALVEAWGDVPKNILVSAFLRSTFPQNHSEEPNSASPFKRNEELERLNALDESIQVHSNLMTSGDEQSLRVNDPEKCGVVSEQVVHFEGTVNLSDEEEADFDIDSWFTNEDVPDTANNPPNNSSSNLKTQLGAFLNSKPNGSANAAHKSNSPSASVVKSALQIIKRFLQTSGCTLEDLTDFTQLETKVLSKL